MTVLTTEKILDSKDNKIRKEPAEVVVPKKTLWRVIAKNEILLRTSSFRNYRKWFFITLYSLLFLWAFIFAPILFDLFMPTLADQFSSVFKPAVIVIIESIMMMLFLMLLIYPLNNVYREGETGVKESLLATPVRPNDIFLGEFLGKAPIYTMIVLLISPIVIGMINPIINFTFPQYLIIYSSVFGLVYFANLVGSIVASWLEHKISKNEKARDLGKALIWIFTIIMVAIMYAIIFFLNNLLTHPELKNWLAFYPSLWFSNIILYIIDPTLLNSFILNIWINLLLVVAIPTSVLYIAYKKAESFYTLETGIEKSNITIVKHENMFYRLIRNVSGRSWGGLIIVQLKRFFRKKANIARIAYIVGLLGFMSWFISRMSEDAFGTVFSSTILIAIGGGIGSIIIGHLAFVDSKDVIWIYKRSPRGIKSLVYSYLLTMLIINILISIFITTLFVIFTSIDILNTIIFFVEFLLFAEISMCQAMGLQCTSPAFGEKDSNMRSNAMISMLLLQPMMFLPIMLLLVIHPETVEMTRILMQVPVFLYNIGISLPLLYFGMRKLNKLE
ncbi:MAG: ABC transporter permease [Promethearchaeota archaeon]